MVVNKTLLKYGTVSFSQKCHKNCHCFPVCHMNGKDNCSDMYSMKTYLLKSIEVDNSVSCEIMAVTTTESDTTTLPHSWTSDSDSKLSCIDHVNDSNQGFIHLSP